MTNEQILEKAKIVSIPYSYKSGNNAYNHTEFLESHNYVIVNGDPIKDCYVHCAYNEHHFTTNWHYRKLIPALNKLFNFGYKRNDFTLIKNILNEGDFSYLIGKQQKVFKVSTHNTNILSDESDKPQVQLSHREYSYLPYNELVSCGFCNDYSSFYNDGLNTPYHRLFKFAHSSAIIENLSENNGKTILVSGDSHTIPILPILCYYYKRVLCCDNRFASFNMFEYLGMDKIDDIDDALLLVWSGNQIEKYTLYNLNNK